MNNSSVLINFNVPNSTKRRFDKLCHLSGKNRTSVLLDLMNDYILNQSDRLSILINRFDLIDKSLSKSNNPSHPSNEFEEPLTFYSSNEDANW